jgi:hypothetical protein
MYKAIPIRFIVLCAKFWRKLGEGGILYVYSTVYARA